MSHIPASLARDEWARVGMSRPMNEADHAAHLQAWCIFQHETLFGPLGFGELLPHQLAGVVENERMAFFKADHLAEQRLDELAELLVQTYAPVAPEVWRKLDEARAAQQVATTHGDSCRYLQAAELAYLRPIVWRNEEWFNHPGT
ncbi:hypothetical protein [Acidovorax sp. A1169]|uniref:hypothetical protein n=1 Tax=Acidovorax sp. A1169 TaxID=3059524 RepID=UPI002737C81F|nr:hypothetical protein [Acidovorax sp. A1169]MDP4075229.1 hypothetical protein [Acidovorax sp. A1169]